MCCCLVQDRPSGGLTSLKLTFAKDHAPIDKLVDVVTTIKPTAIIGLYSLYSYSCSKTIDGGCLMTDSRLFWYFTNADCS